MHTRLDVQEITIATQNAQKHELANSIHVQWFRAFHGFGIHGVWHPVTQNTHI